MNMKFYCCLFLFFQLEINIILRCVNNITIKDDEKQCLKNCSAVICLRSRNRRHQKENSNKNKESQLPF